MLADNWGQSKNSCEIVEKSSSTRRVFTLTPALEDEMPALKMYSDPSVVGFKGLKVKVQNRKPGKGLTLIEVLVLVAVLAVLLAFANPMLRDNSARLAIKEATVQVALALHKARNSARSGNTDVTVMISANPAHNTLAFEYPKPGSSGTMPSLPSVTLPAGISVSSDTPALTFDPQGKVSAGGSIRLTSSADTDFYATVLLKSTSGRVKTSYGLQGGQRSFSPVQR